MKFVVFLLITLVIVSADVNSGTKNQGHRYNNKAVTGDDSGTDSGTDYSTDSGDDYGDDNGDDSGDYSNGDNIYNDNMFFVNQTDFPVAKPKEQVPDTEELVKLQTQVTELDRLKLLQPDDFVFDFLHSVSGVSKGAGGNTVAATSKNFPALIGHDIAMTVGFIEPCGINLPHIHPRATEINFIVSGEFQAGFFSENGGKFIGHTLKPGMATVFPRGVIHFEVNLQCERAVFVAAFNNQDPGVTTIASAFFGLPTQIVGVSLGNLDISNVEELMKQLPMNPASVEECRKRCGLY
jgi:oxalate decarboxylase/phosphoglucose isomerase-like protein (cupin superfamily)